MKNACSWVERWTQRRERWRHRWERIHFCFDIFQYAVWICFFTATLGLYVATVPWQKLIHKGFIELVGVATIVASFYGLAAFVCGLSLAWILGRIHDFIEEHQFNLGMAVRCLLPEGGYTGAYAPTEGWTRLIPEKIERIPTPKPRSAQQP